MRRLLYNPNFTVVEELEDWIVVNKPAHLLSHPGKPGNPPTLLEGVQHLLGYEIANGAALGVVTRLDRDTSGLVIISKNPRAALQLSLAIQGGEIDKQYVAVVWGWPEEDKWTVEEPILRRGEVEHHRGIWVKQMVHPEGRYCRTRFEVIRRFEKQTTNGTRFSLIRCHLDTGRMHQIRVHLSYAGFPVVGDKLYGPDEGIYRTFIPTGWTQELQDILLLDHHALHCARVEYQGHVWRAELPPELIEFIGDAVPLS